MDGEGVELELQLQEIDEQENCDDEKTETSISVEEDVLSEPDVTVVTDQESLEVNGVRERISSVSSKITGYRYIQYKRPSAISVVLSESTSNLAKASLEDEPFSTTVIMNPLIGRRNFFEVEITDAGAKCMFAIGVGPRNFPLTVMPGWLEGSFGYHSNGKLFIEQGNTPINGPKCTQGDRMGCGLDFSTANEGFVKVWFTKNGKLACWPEKILYHPKLALHPIITVGSSGEIVHYCNHSFKDIPDAKTIYPWYIIAGFTDTSEIPFYSKEDSFSKYGAWEDDPNDVDAAHLPQPEAKLTWSGLCDALRDALPEHVHTLGRLSASTYSEWVEMADSMLTENEKYLQNIKLPKDELAPTGTEKIALFLALECLTTIKSINSGQMAKRNAIMAYLSLGFESQYQNITMIAGLLFMGCSADSSFKHSHVFHNPDISVSLVHLLLNWGGNPNVPDAIGRTPLHIHQNNRALMRTFLDYNADVHALDDERNSPLNYAGINGRNGVADILIGKGALPSASYGGKPSSLDITAGAGHFDCFKQMLRLSVKNLISKKGQQQVLEDKWKDAVCHLPKWKKVNLAEIEELSCAEFYCVSVKQAEEDDDKYSVKKLVSVAAENKITLKPEVFTTIFDRCLYGQNAIIADILDADINGDVDASNASNEGTTLLTYLSKRPKLLLSLVSHDTLKGYIADQWQKKALVTFWLRVLFFVFQLLLLTFALAIAARPEITDEELNAYSHPIDIFRGVCEGLFIFIIITKMFDEVVELLYGGIRDYISDITNYIEWLGIILILLIIPLRATNNHGQWIVASLAYMAFGMKMLYLASLFDATGQYVQALTIIISRDVVKFLSIFLVLLFIIGGAFYLSLRYDASLQILESNSTNAASYIPGDTRLLHEIYFTGLRTLIEAGPTLTYYSSDSHFGALAVIWYLFFLFIVVIVLLNVLIAQVSDTYAKILDKAEGYKLFNQCLYIAKLEQLDSKVCMTHALHILLHKCKCCMFCYNNCCKSDFRKGNRKVDANVFWNRPRILAIRTAQVGSTSKFHSAKKQLKQVTARYLPDTLEVSDGIASGGHQDEDIESRLDATNQNLKELGEDLMGAIQRQNDILSGLMKNNHSTMLNEFAMQKKNIQSDINMSEEQEQKTSTLLTRLNKLHSDMTKQLDDLRMLLFEKEQELKKDLASQEERLQLQLTKHQENLQLEFPRLQEEMTKQQLDLKLEFPRQKDMMSNLLAQEMEILVKKIQNLQIQIAEEREYILHSTKSDIAEQ